METIPPTFGAAFKIWWWFTWRWALLVVLLSFTVGFIANTLGSRFELDQGKLKNISIGISAVLFCLVQIYLFRVLLNHKFRRFTVGLIKQEK